MYTLFAVTTKQGESFSCWNRFRSYCLPDLTRLSPFSPSAVEKNIMFSFRHLLIANLLLLERPHAIQNFTTLRTPSLAGTWILLFLRSALPIHPLGLVLEAVDIVTPNQHPRRWNYTAAVGSARRRPRRRTQV